MKKTDKISRTHFLEKYCDLSLYDIYLMKIYTIDHEDIHFVNKYLYYLIVNTDHPDVTSME